MARQAMARTVPARTGLAERAARGRALRRSVPRSAHGRWRPARGRDLLAILKAADRGRLSALLPIRYGRLLQSPFAFLRGSASLMAYDLSETPATGFRVQACGDCHLLNFGCFATPERRVIFDINDFDETLPAPWEWDLKRLCASIRVAGRSGGFGDARAQDAVRTAAEHYREAMADYARRGVLQTWYDRVDAENVLGLGQRGQRGQRNQRDQRDQRGQSGGQRRAPQALSERYAAHAAGVSLEKLTEGTGAQRRIRERPPLVYHADSPALYEAKARRALKAYRDTLPEERRVLFDRFSLVDVAMKVVGVGSVGTRCAIALLVAGDADSLFLQFKEARASVLEPYAGRSAYAHHGQRVVVGQRMMQAASDLFLGWSSTGRPPFDFYVRQLRDLKSSVHLDDLRPSEFGGYAGLCGRARARAHARTGDPAMIAGYLGGGTIMDRALVQFSTSYADQAEKDYAQACRALRGGARGAGAR